MEYINIKLSNGLYSKEKIYNIDDFPYPVGEYDIVKKSGKHGKKYVNVPCAFDIESTTVKPPKDEKGNYTFKPYAYMYVWQFCFIDRVVMGRTWEEYESFIKKLSESLGLSDKKRLVVYVHFLSYEFVYIAQIFKWKTVFAKDKRKVLKAVDCNGIEYRCSYFLSNMSLKKFCENTPGALYWKKSGDEFNYNKKRTPFTKLTQTEKAYCFCDVRGLCECISYLMKEDDLSTIPLTSTGYVRRDFKIAMKTKKNIELFHNLKLTGEQYLFLKDIFRGGNCHANRDKVGIVVSDVGSFDEESAYPFCMLHDYFPMGEFKRIIPRDEKELDTFIDRYCCMIDITFFNIKTNDAIPYIDIAHCYERSDILNDNGRVLSAKLISIKITELDYKIISSSYEFTNFKINDFFITKRGKLPLEYRYKIFQYAKIKTALKGVAGKEYEYMKSKNKLNASFGFLVTDIAHDEYTFNFEKNEWEVEKVDVDSAVESYYDSDRNFLPYQWGVWVTAHSRYHLQEFLSIMDNDDIVYTDTDCVKGLNMYKYQYYIYEYNKKVIQFWEELKWELIDSNGKRHYLGIWDDDGHYERFKTYGAKKYCVEKKGDIIVTVSGMNKELASKAVKKKGGIEKGFSLSTVFENVGRTVSWYNDENRHYIELDGKKVLTAGSIGVLDTTYTLDIGKEYYEIVKKNFLSKNVDIDIFL